VVSDIATLVRRFYYEAWNAWDDTIVDDLLAPGFAFRGRRRRRPHLLPGGATGYGSDPGDRRLHLPDETAEGISFPRSTQIEMLFANAGAYGRVSRSPLGWARSWR
jgi:hypothetical protein